MADFLKPDLCILGAGALGTSLAIAARARGLDVIVVPLPRDAANDPLAGDLRRAAIVASAARAQDLRQAGELGLDNGQPKINFRNIGERAAAVADALVPRDDPARLAALGINVLAGDARFLDRQTLGAGEARIKARQFALASGAQPLVPDLPGLADIAYFTPATIADNLRKLSHLVVIGGTPVALQLAQAYCRLGSMVTMVPQGGLLPGFDPELVAILLRALRAEGLTILEDAQVTAIHKRSQGTGIALRRAAGDDTLDVSHILLAMGGVPDLDAGLLDAAKLKRDPKRPAALQLGADGQTSNSRISAIGGAAGVDAAHIATRRATLLVERLTGKSNGRLDPRRLPRLVDTQPALAEFGSLDSYTPLRPGQMVLRSNLAENEAARALGLAHGVAKLVVDRAGTIAGAGLVGAGAGELAALLALADGLKLGALGQLALPQPSLAAMLVDLCDQFAALPKPGGWMRR